MLAKVHMLKSSVYRTHLNRRSQDIYNHVQRWTGLQGPGSVPIIGTTFDRRLPALITPYYRNGNVIDFVKAHPAANKLKIVGVLSAC